MNAPLVDPYLILPLHGQRLIEASAGTGKTYTLATLVQRLVLEQGLRIGQILAVTYTEAATQELRKRIRERLQLTLQLLDATPSAADKGEVALTQALLQQHRAAGKESEAALRRRLRLATVEIDLAAIFTIHGFCARVLREHALEAGQGFAAQDLLANERALREEVAADLWRNHAQTASGADDLNALWKGGYTALAQDMPALLGDAVLVPPATANATSAGDPLAQLQVAGNALAASFRTHGDDFLAALRAALAGKVLNGKSYTLGWIEPLWQQWAQWCIDADYTAQLDTRIGNLTAAAMLAKCNKNKGAQVPTSPLTCLIEDYVSATQAYTVFRDRRRANLLHHLREAARTRMASLKRQRLVQGHDDLIAGVADALAGAPGKALAQCLRAQYAVALVDEFQDTDARQWHIFEQVFGSGSAQPALFLIGDPKQAIYGFRGGDVHTYLAAANAESTERAPSLVQNFRSRPALLAAIDALYTAAGNAAFADTGISFIQVSPGGNRNDADYLRHGEAAPALTLWQVPATGAYSKDDKPTRWPVGDSRDKATAACAAAIHAVLSDARAGKAQLQGRPVQPGDIAVLVRTHNEATQIQNALVVLGIPAVAAGKRSVFATEEARELHTLLLALLHGADDGRLRAALSTVLVGESALHIAALEHDGPAHHQWQQQAQHWREQLRSGGPLALIGTLCAAQAQRLLGLLDGERRLSNYLQLAERLQEAQQQALGLHGLVDWLGRAMTSADGSDESQLLRLESDARCVQIVTLHKSKGLEYPLVYLPFVGIGSNEKSPGRCCTVHHDVHHDTKAKTHNETHNETHGDVHDDVHDETSRRRLHWKLEALPEAEWEHAKTTWQRDQRAEETRLLYVGLTRAQHALWLACGDFYASNKTALAPMLAMRETWQAAGIFFDSNPTPNALPRLLPEASTAVVPARSITRTLHNDWWVHSFSQLSNADAGTERNSAATVPASGGNDEPAADAVTHPATEAGPEAKLGVESESELGAEASLGTDSFDPRFSGNRFGVALHAALEHADFSAWRDWRDGAPAPAEEASGIAKALAAEGYASALISDGVALSTRLMGHTLTVTLPEGLRLCELPEAHRRAEIEFQFALQPVQVDALLALLHAHGIVRARDRFGSRRRLEGLMTGLIDLTYQHAGKWYVLDYKSNRLPGYGPAQLEQAMAHSEYDLQALIYTLALHRWLRFRLGDGYDYARDFGGIRYVFCRGLDANLDTKQDANRNDAPAPGIHAQCFSPALVHALDALFGQPTEGAST